MLEGFFSKEREISSNNQEDLPKVNTFGCYFMIESDLILMDCRKGIIPLLINSGVLENVSCTHIFITSANDILLEGAAELIKFLYHSVFDQNMNNICVYYPDLGLLSKLQLYKASSKWYYLYTNMWDYIFILGYRKCIEYVFVRNTDSKSFSIEFIVRKGISFLYSGISKEFCSKLSDGMMYDHVFQSISFQNTDLYCISYQDFCEAYKKAMVCIPKDHIYLVGETENPDESLTEEEGFPLLIHKSRM